MDGPYRIGVVVHKSLRDQLFRSQDLARLEQAGELKVTDSIEPITASRAAELLRDCDIAIGSWNTPFPTAALLEACPGLKLWMHAAGTVKHMFGEHLSRREPPLIIASCKTAIAEDVAEMVLGEIIIGVRQVIPNAAANRSGVAGPRGKVLSQSTVGLIGWSQVGQRVAQRLRPTGCRIMVHDPTVGSIQIEGIVLEPDLTRLCASCDVISLHTPDIPACRAIIGEQQLAAMRDDAVFINSSRGACVDEAALVKELGKGRLFAFLDVSNPEPAASDSPLRSLPNVVYTSHIAGPPSYRIGEQAVSDVLAFIAGGQPICVVRQEDLDFTA